MLCFQVCTLDLLKMLHFFCLVIALEFGWGFTLPPFLVLACVFYFSEYWVFCSTHARRNLLQPCLQRVWFGLFTLGLVRSSIFIYFNVSLSTRYRGRGGAFNVHPCTQLALGTYGPNGTDRLSLLYFDKIWLVLMCVMYFL